MAIAADAVAHAAMSVAEAPPDAIDVVDDVGVDTMTVQLSNFFCMKIVHILVLETLPTN